MQTKQKQSGKGRQKAIIQKLRQDKGYICLQINHFIFANLGGRVCLLLLQVRKLRAKGASYRATQEPASLL